MIDAISYSANQFEKVFDSKLRKTEQESYHWEIIASAKSARTFLSLKEKGRMLTFSHLKNILKSNIFEKKINPTTGNYVSQRYAGIAEIKRVKVVRTRSGKTYTFVDLLVFPNEVNEI